MFWIIAGIVVVLGFAFAWFSSGFNKKPDTIHPDSAAGAAGQGSAKGYHGLKGHGGVNGDIGGPSL